MSRSKILGSCSAGADGAVHYTASFSCDHDSVITRGRLKTTTRHIHLASARRIWVSSADWHVVWSKEDGSGTAGTGRHNIAIVQIHVEIAVTDDNRSGRRGNDLHSVKVRSRQGTEVTARAVIEERRLGMTTTHQGEVVS